MLRNYLNIQLRMGYRQEFSHTIVVNLYFNVIHVCYKILRFALALSTSIEYLVVCIRRERWASSGQNDYFIRPALLLILNTVNLDK